MAPQGWHKRQQHHRCVTGWHLWGTWFVPQELIAAPCEIVMVSMPPEIEEGGIGQTLMRVPRMSRVRRLVNTWRNFAALQP